MVAVVPVGTTAEPGVDIQGVGAWSRYFSPRTDAFRQFQYIVNISNDIDIGPGEPPTNTQFATEHCRDQVDSGI